MQPIRLGCAPLSVEDVVAVARDYHPVVLDETARKRVRLSRAVVDKLLDEKIKVYGLTTGFASQRDVIVEDPRLLSKNLVRSHAAGVGDALPEDVVRAAMLLRAQALAQGYSGVTPALIEVLIALLAARVYPYIPAHGSVGCSGDLAQLSHLALTVIGDPMARVHRRVLSDAEVTEVAVAEDAELDFADHVGLRRAESGYIALPQRSDFIRIGAESSKVRERLSAIVGEDVWPYELLAKEGLASNNGAVFTTAVLALAVHDGERLLDTAELATALSLEAHQTVLDPLHKGVRRARPHDGHEECAKKIARALAGSQLVRVEAAVGLNMSRFNRTMLELHSLARSADSPADAKRLGDLWRCMEGLQAELWSRIDRERARVLASALPEAARTSAYPKALELRACRRALGVTCGDEAAAEDSIEAHWRRLIGWGDGERIESGALRERLTRVYLESFCKIVREIGNPQIQDNYSMRGAATILGACRETCREARRVVEIEGSSATDNPLILLEELLDPAGLDATRIARESADDLVAALEAWFDEPCAEAAGFRSGPSGSMRNWALAADAVRSAANFHGEPVGMAADHLAVAIAELGAIAERRCAVLADVAHSNGLPSFLVWKQGLNSGLMITQYCAASIVSENKILAVPASVDSIPTGENSEDHVAMSFLASRKLAKIVENSEYLVAIELVTAYQAMQFRKPARLGRLTAQVESVLHDRLAPLLAAMTTTSRDAYLDDLGLGRAARDAVKACVLDDVVVAPLLDSVADLVRRGVIAAIATTK